MKHYILSVLIAFILLSCTKKHVNTGGRTSTVTPFSQYLTQSGDTVNVTLHQNDYPLEIGYSFEASVSGNIYALGLRLPDSSKSYMMTIWDASTKTALIQKPVKCNSTTAFTYLDLNATNEAFAIDANHIYVVSVNITPVNSSAPARFYYDARRSDQKDIFPITENAITFLEQYNKTTTTPAFPDNLNVYHDVINGLVDIGFSHVDQ